MPKGLQVLFLSLILVFTGIMLASSALAATTTVLSSSSVNDLALWIAGSQLASILFAIGLAGILLELFAVGRGLVGSLGVIALAVYFGSYMTAGQIGWEAVGLFVTGLILVALELFILPGGVAGIIGAGLMLSCVYLVTPNPQEALISLITSLLGAAAIVWIGLRFMTKRDLWSKMVLRDRQRNQEGYVAAQVDLARLLNQEGRTLTPLRPSGMAEFHGQRIDVVTEGGFVAAGITVKVVKVEGTRVVVRSY